MACQERMPTQSHSTVDAVATIVSLVIGAGVFNALAVVSSADSNLLGVRLDEWVHNPLALFTAPGHVLVILVVPATVFALFICGDRGEAAYISVELWDVRRNMVAFLLLRQGSLRSCTCRCPGSKGWSTQKRGLWTACRA